MEIYIGTKEVEAEVMSLGAFVCNFKRNPYPEGSDEYDVGEMGYHVRYMNPDGSVYDSWSPKDVFEKSYKIAETFVDRMEIEKGECFDKISDLVGFARSEAYSGVLKRQPVLDFLVEEQAHVYERLARILEGRLSFKHGNGLECAVRSLGFGEAIGALLYGLAVRRAGWNDNGLFVVKQVPSHITGDIIPNMQSLPQSAKDLLMKRENPHIDYTNQMLIVNHDGIADSWVPSSSDIFARDWEIVLDK